MPATRTREGKVVQVPTLSGSVGQKGANNWKDVKLIQYLLNQLIWKGKLRPYMAPVFMDGSISNNVKYSPMSRPKIG